MLWSNVKTSFIIIFLALNIAFLILLGVTLAGTGLNASEVTEIVTLCDRYGISLAAETVPTQATRMPSLEARFMTAADLPAELRESFTFDANGGFVYENPKLNKTYPKDEESSRRLLLETLNIWGIEGSDLQVKMKDPAHATISYTFQNRPILDCTMDVVLSENGILSAVGHWLTELTVTRGAETIVDAPTVLAKLIEEESLCHRGLTVSAVEIGYFPESAGEGVVHKIFPLSPAYRVTLSDGTVRTYFASYE